MKLNRIENFVKPYAKAYAPDFIYKMKKEVNEQKINDLVSKDRIDLREKQVIAREGMSRTATERILGLNDLVDINYFFRGIEASRSVCRIILRDVSLREVGYATGFKISPSLLITNFHVFESEQWARNAIIEFNFELNSNGNPKPTTRFSLSPDRFFVNNKNLDYAIVAINPTSVFGLEELKDFGFLRLNPKLGKINKGEYATIIQHPGGQSKQLAIRENQIINDIVDDDFTLMYYSDTAQGSSGAPVFNDSWQVVALHFTGVPRKDENGNWLLKNGSIATGLDDDADVDWISNSGIRTSKIVNSFIELEIKGDLSLRQEFIDASNGEILSELRKSEPSDNSNHLQSAIPKSSNSDEGYIDANLNQLLFQKAINIPLIFSLHLGDIIPPFNSISLPKQSTIDQLPSVSFGLEAKKKPFYDLDYSNRKGYDPNFLGVDVPIPKVLNSDNLSKMVNGDYYIPYHKFTIVNNKQRKLALFTASNIDGSSAAKNPDPDKVYSRDALAGLTKSDTEEWFIDPRIPQADQLSDEFYNKDRMAFDKGHLVRRDDVAWGKDYLEVRYSNGDTFHITNCSPQVKDFNRSNLGGRWGMLENTILNQAKYEKLSVFSGPILYKSDPIFKGVNFQNSVEIKIPKAYWKIIIALSENGILQSFAFLLSQDLSQVQFEFDLEKQWKGYMVSISYLENLIGNIKFDPIVNNADQFESETGVFVLNQSQFETLK
ncbi:DNA/RNA non-specific endonuclease [Algoriphagus aquimarinus]|uniref:Serine protease n=1 Tax=Algoriphagus aquimarinus TaxID=237018 RepID=A0A5C7AZ65_9BACT|nr:DNA/RNA non-specific endonuclease [Algoriphagus aquimarinus]TXE13464.1 hypothetical protein ESV85_05685 [Algoriphagus aquimarinus]